MEPQKRDENLKKTFWKLAHARQALSHVLTTCDFYLKHVADDDHPMHVPLVCSICVTYARPFTDNKGIGMISSKFTRYSDGRLQRTHEILWAARKQFYAHSDATVTATSESGSAELIQPIDVTISRRKNAHSDRLTFGYNLHEIRLRGIVIRDVQDLCSELDRRLEAEITETMQQLFSPKMPELSRLFDKAHADHIRLRLDFPFGVEAN